MAPVTDIVRPLFYANTHTVSTSSYYFRGGERMLYCGNKVIP